MGQEPWIDPDGASAQEIVRIIENCPSDVLAYSLDGVEANVGGREATITVKKDGPYAVSGGIELEALTPGAGGSSERYTLCRCGDSQNKPFCDGSHWHVGFDDSAE